MNAAPENIKVLNVALRQKCLPIPGIRYRMAAQRRYNDYADERGWCWRAAGARKERQPCSNYCAQFPTKKLHIAKQNNTRKQ